jgi:hypothetical protein
MSIVRGDEIAPRQYRDPANHDKDLPLSRSSLHASLHGVATRGAAYFLTPRTMRTLPSKIIASVTRKTRQYPINSQSAKSDPIIVAKLFDIV